MASGTERSVIAFDLDDTLYKEYDYVASGYRAVARAMADATGADPAELYRLFWTHRPRGFEAAIEVVKGRPGAEAFTVESMVELYRAHTPDIHLAPGVADTLARLRARGHILALITDGSTRHQRAKIKALGLEPFFDPADILISEETGGDKTTDIPFEIIERRYGPCRRTYVGDNLSKDFHRPRLRGWHTVMLRDPEGRNVFPQRPCDHPAEYRPDTTVDSLADLGL